jgi:hypothetical protein
LLSSGHNGPANICFNERDNIIAVPNFNSNSVSFVSVSPSSVNDDNDKLINFNLYQNYPNPFNSSTKIKFTLAPSLSLGERVSEGRVRATLKVYDVLGKEQATLVDEEKPAGTYEVNFNAEGLSSGLYFYTLTVHPSTGSINGQPVQDFSETKKMIFLK